MKGKYQKIYPWVVVGLLWIVLFYFAAPSFPGWAVKNWMPTLFAQSLHLDMAVAGPMATITIAGSSLFSIILGGIVADRWISYNLRGRIFTGVIGLTLMVPALILLGYGLMNMTGITAGAVITTLLGKSTDSGTLGPDVALLAIPIVVAIILQLTVLKPKFADKLED